MRKEAHGFSRGRMSLKSTGHISDLAEYDEWTANLDTSQAALHRAEKEENDVLVCLIIVKRQAKRRKKWGSTSIRETVAQFADEYSLNVKVVG